MLDSGYEAIGRLHMHIAYPFKLLNQEHHEDQTFHFTHSNIYDNPVCYYLLRRPDGPLRPPRSPGTVR